ncbi:MAG: zinc-ribbon domain-containing protein [Acidobacteriota bacterium]|nr:zinc-ribbon domain-containing protein [Acidobacteriota bacterium]
MIKIVCTSCQKALSLDETKLPMKEVTFPCPACKTKLTVDRRKLEGAPAPVPGASPEASEEEEEGFGAKALIVGNDSPALRQAAKQIGFMPIHMAAAQQARDYFMQEYPPVVFLNPAQTTAPPLEVMQPIIALAPNDRRRSFFILVSENLRTLDGNAAFLYGVNLIVSLKDLGSFPQIYRDASAYHDRLYNAMNSVTKVLAER